MKKSLASILLVYVLTIFNLQPTNAITNGNPAVEGLAVKVSSYNSNCTGVIWKTYIVITAAHCVVTSAGNLVSGLSVSAFINNEWVQTDVAGVKIPKEYVPHDDINAVGESNISDIAFLILKSALWNNLKFPNLRIATSDDWDKYKNAQTTLEVDGYGFIGETELLPDKSPVAAILYLDVGQSSGNKDWAVLHSNTSTACHGDSGSPVLYYRSAESALVLVGILTNARSSLIQDKCGNFQSGTSQSYFVKLSSYSALANSILDTETKYRPSAYLLTGAFTKLDIYRTGLSNLVDFADQLTPTTKKRVFDNNKNVDALNSLLSDYFDKLYEFEDSLTKSMDFTSIYSDVTDTSASPQNSKIASSLGSFETKIDALITKISRVLPYGVCKRDSLTKDLPSSKKCPKGYKKTELTKPF
jgi:hypothetical protein